MKCLLCQMWKRLRWNTVKDTGVWIYQFQPYTGKRRVVKGPLRGYQPIDQHWLKTGEWS